MAFALQFEELKQRKAAKAAIANASLVITLPFS